MPVREGFGGAKPRAEASFEHGEAEKGLPAIPDAPPKKKLTERWAFSLFLFLYFLCLGV